MTPASHTLPVAADHSGMRYRDWLNLNVHLLWCYDLPVGLGRRDAGPFWRSTSFTNSCAWLVREGWAQVEHDRQCHRAEIGQWLIVKPGKRLQTFSKDARLLSIAFDARWPDGTHLFDKGLSLVVNANEAPALLRLVRPMLGSMQSLNASTWDARDRIVDLPQFLNIERHLLRWLAALAGVLDANRVPHSGHFGLDERVRNAVDLIHSWPLAGTLDMERLSGLVGLSQNHLIRLFRRDLKTTPGQYWDRLRIEHARHRLLQPDARIKAVALELGFNYLSHFSKWFKRHAGVAPRDMRA